MAEIKLSRGMVAIVDDCYYEELSQHKWHVVKGNPTTWYAVRHVWISGTGKKIVVRMHREVVRLSGREVGKFVDHIDGNGLNNCDGNLRSATAQENKRNSRVRSDSLTGIKGVAYVASKNAWRSRIFHNGRNRHLGYFQSPEAASEAYSEAAERIFGEFARVN